MPPMMVLVKLKSRQLPALAVKAALTHWPPPGRICTPLVAPVRTVKALLEHELPARPITSPALMVVSPV